MKNVYWRILGGLGNQMFEYAFLYALLKRNNSNPIIKCYKHYDENEDKRLYALEPFNISLKYSVEDEHKSFNKFTYYLMKRKLLTKIIGNKSKEYISSFLIKNGIYLSDNSVVLDIENVKTNKEVILIEGYFQSYLYFDEYRKEIQNEFKIIKQFSKNTKKTNEEIMSCNSVCVHIRRGDYLNSYYAPRFNICDYNYYKKSMDYICGNVDNPVFYIFSNSHKDIEWIKENYDFSGYNIKYVDLNNSDYEDLQLMISCKHFVISNSTYSWWAQYLCENDKKIVVAPSKWRKIDTEQSPLIMPEFKLIDVE